MNTEEFWAIIESTLADGRACEGFAARLEKQLSAMPPAEIVSFGERLHEVLDRAYTWALWGAAYVINGGCSDDGFEYFRGWLVAQGRRVFEAAIADPDSLAGVAKEDAECEDLLTAAVRAHATATGSDQYPTPAARGRTEPAGTHWSEEELDGLYPRLTALFG